LKSRSSLAKSQNFWVWLNKPQSPKWLLRQSLQLQSSLERKLVSKWTGLCFQGFAHCNQWGCRKTATRDFYSSSKWLKLKKPRGKLPSQRRQRLLTKSWPRQMSYRKVQMLSTSPLSYLGMTNLPWKSQLRRIQNPKGPAIWRWTWKMLPRMQMQVARSRWI
jgi:hypothetical protein